jgi:acyl dehydratase
MPFPGSLVGRSTAPVTQTVDGSWLTAFAHAVGDAGSLSHPLFPVCVEWPAVIAAARLDDGALSGAERRRGVHTTHDLTIHRAVRPDDVLTTTATVVALEARSRGTAQRVRLDTRDAEGSPVATTLMGSMFLGVGISGPPPARAPEPAPTEAPWTVIASIGLEVAADHALRYSEASRIWNPIHTDANAAVAAGLAAPILHGTCTLAMATSAALAWAGIDGRSLRRVRARFSGMVPMPATLELRLGRATAPEPAVHFTVVDADHSPVLSGGRLDFTP